MNHVTPGAVYGVSDKAPNKDDNERLNTVACVFKWVFVSRIFFDENVEARTRILTVCLKIHHDKGKTTLSRTTRVQLRETREFEKKFYFTDIIS